MVKRRGVEPVFGNLGPARVSAADFLPTMLRDAHPYGHAASWERLVLNVRMSIQSLGWNSLTPFQSQQSQPLLQQFVSLTL